MKIGPVSYRDAARFHPTLALDDQVRLFSIMGGTPIYLRRWEPTRSVRDNLVTLFRDPSSGLVDSVELSLAANFPDSSGSRAMLAVAQGKTTYNEIVQAAKLNDRVIPRLVDVSQQLEDFVAIS
jgi:uncharacterized protein